MQLKSFSENRTYGVSSALGCYAEQGCFFLFFFLPPLNNQVYMPSAVLKVSTQRSERHGSSSQGA